MRSFKDLGKQASPNLRLGGGQFSSENTAIILDWFQSYAYFILSLRSMLQAVTQSINPVYPSVPCSLV